MTDRNRLLAIARHRWALAEHRQQHGLSRHRHLWPEHCQLIDETRWILKRLPPLYESEKAS